MATTITKGEFTRFYDEALGKDWYIDEWDVDSDLFEVMSGTDSVELDLLVLDWQGSGRPQPTEWISRRDLEWSRSGGTLDGMALLAKWRAKQRSRTMSFEVPLDKVGEFLALAEWARSYGVDPNTAYRWFRDATMPVPARRLASGTIVVGQEPTTAAGGRTVTYCRVSSHDQRDDLERQAGRVGLWASEHGLSVDEVVTEVGSGLSAKRPRLVRLLADGEVDDDLVREMTEVLASFCARLYGRRGARNRALRAITMAKNAEVA